MAILTPEKFEDLNRDIEDTGKAINIVGIITPRYGEAFKSLPLVSKEAENRGGFISAPNLTALQAIMPSYNWQLARDDSTGNEYRWNPAATPTPKWEPTGRNYLNDSKIYTDQQILSFDLKVKNYIQVPKDVSNILINKRADTATPKFGSLLLPLTGSSASTGTYILLPAAAVSIVIKRFSVVANVSGGDLELRTYTRSGDTFTVKKVIAKLKTYKVGVNEFNSYDFNEFTLDPNDYIGIVVLTSGAMVYNGSSSTDVYYSNSYTGLNPVVGTAGKFNLKCGFFDVNGSERAKQFVDYLDTVANESEVNFANILISNASTIGLALQPSTKSGTNNGIAHDVIGKSVSGFGTLSLLEVYSAVAGPAQVGVYSRNGNVFTRKRFQDVNLAAGLNSIPLALSVSNGEYVGLLTTIAGQIAYETTSIGHDGMFTSGGTWTASEFTSSTPNPAMTWAYQIRFTLNIKSLASNVSVKKWLNKNYASSGDSITWYNGQIYWPGQVEAGQLCVGYQSYIVDALGCNLINTGVSGATMPTIYRDQIANRDYSNIYLTTITAGANDHKNGVLVGAVQPIGSAFNTTNSYAGALQASIEHIISSNPDCKIVLITPIKGWYSQETADAIPNPALRGQTLLSVQFANVMKEVAALYSLPVVDWYNTVGFNELNRYHFLGDDPVQVPQYTLHPKLIGFKRMGEILLSDLKNY